MKKLKQILIESTFEILIFIGLSFLFIGLYMIYKPIAFIGIGIMFLILSFLLFKTGRG